MKTINDFTDTELMIALKDRGYALSIWDISDVVSKAEECDIEITEEEALQIISDIDENHDATIGINWDVISNHLYDLERSRK